MNAPQPNPGTREALIQAARDVFSRKGLDGTTVKEIADSAGVNISLISYHFDGKDGLYRACLESFGRERLSVAQRMLGPVTTASELRVRLGLFVEEILACYAVDLDLLRMIHRECESESALTQDIFEKTFLQVFKSLVDFLSRAAESSILRKDLDPPVCAALLMGAISQLGMKDHISKRYFGRTIQDEQYRTHVAQQVISSWLDGWLASTPSRGP